MITTTQGPHSLACRVLRLCRPSLCVDLPLPSPAPSDPLLSDSSELDYRSRFLLRPLCAIYLGETFCSYISINNSSNFEVRHVTIKAEIQTEKQRILLLDTTKSPVESIRSGDRYDFIIEHEVKELGAHTLVCTALYSDGDSKRKYLPPAVLQVHGRQSSFSLDQACLENHTKSTLYMGQIEFEPSQNWSATLLKPDEHQMEIISPPREIFKAPILIRSGGIQNYLYRLQSSSQGSGPLKQEGGNVLGKLQITWQTNLGEPGRLQTQQILGTVSALNFREGNCYELLGDSLHVPVNRPLLMVFFRKMLGQRYAVEWGAVQDACCNMLLHESYYLDLKSNSAAISWQDVDLRILDIPAAIRLGRSFPVHFNLMNLTDRELGPFKVLISENNFPDKRAVMVNGPHKKNLIATKLGVQKIGGITVFGTIEKKTYEHLPELEAF